MSWGYVQRSGSIRDPSGVKRAIGYSGHGLGLNNPYLQDAHAVGPIPVGSYDIGAPQSPVGHLGPLAMPLIPAKGNAMHGRSAFFIHGDNQKMDHTASDGCIILPPDVRRMIAESSDRLLIVIAEEP